MNALKRLMFGIIFVSALLTTTITPITFAEAESNSFQCIGAPATDPGVPGLGTGMYPEKRVYLEGQSWWPNREQHAHLGVCVPADQHVSGPITTNFQLQLHEMTGYASKLYQKVSTDTCSTCGEKLTFTNALSTAYRNDNPNSHTYWITTTFDPAAASDKSGWQEVKSRLEIKVADGIVRPAVRYMAYIDNGKSRDDNSRAWTDAYGWQTKTAYAHGILLPTTQSPYSGSVPTGPVSGIYTFRVRHESTTDGVSHNITGWDVTVDPALHANPPSMGVVLGSGTTTCPIGKGTCQGPTTTYKLDTTKFSNGVHYVTIFSHNIFDSTHENTGVLKFPIVVQN